MIWLALGLGVQLAHADEIPTDRPTVPSAGLAAESSPAMLWVNPASMAFEPDSRFGAYTAWNAAGDESSLGLTAGASGLSVGLHHLRRDDAPNAWTLDYATSLRLPHRTALGMRTAWHLREGLDNRVAFDAGLATRPLPWLGLGAVARNIASPDPQGGLVAETGAGLALRPLGESLMVGLDWIHAFHPDEPGDRVVAGLRARPFRGGYLRASADSRGTFTVGAELFLGGWGFGGMLPHRLEGQVGDAGGAAWIASGAPGETALPGPDRVPRLVLERTPPYQRATGLFALPHTTWLETLERLRRAEEERGVSGLVLVLGDAPLSWARAQELRTRLLALEAAGRPVTVYLHGAPSTGDYYVASAASRVLLHPAQDLRLLGLASELTFFRGTLDLLGIEPQFLRRSEYKSAVEAYTASEPSLPALEQVEDLLDDIFDELVGAIAQGRSKERAEVEAWIDGGPYTAAEALELGMVDALAYPDQLDRALEALHGRAVRTPDLHRLPQPHSGWEASSQIAVVYVEGVIVPGRSSRGGLLGGPRAGSTSVVRSLNEARENPFVRAVVLRVDSPGGSAFASDEIHRAVERLVQDGKPVVVSMGGVAASGGYYVAAGADAIWAEPTTITGSIGVFYGKIVTGGLFEKVGVTTTTVTRGRNAALHSPSQPWDELQEQRVQALVDHVYDTFTDKVAQGRGLSAEQVEEVARGRVWSGRRAQEVGLVDALGGLHEAIEDARDRAGIPADRRVALVTYDDRGNLLEGLSPAQLQANPVNRMLLRHVQQAAEPLELPLPFLQAYDPLWAWASNPGEQVWMMAPYTLEVVPR